MQRLFKPYTEKEYAQREIACSVLFLFALVWIVVIGVWGVRAFIGTACIGVFTGAAFGSYTKRHTERGLWMLALLFGGFIAGMYLVGAAVVVIDMMHRRPSTSSALMAVDIAIAGVLAQVAARASWTVVVQNRRLGRE